MQSPEEAIQQAQAAVDEAKATHGETDVRVSYKLDELAAVLKENGRLLDAANAAAKARAIRTANLAKESGEQAEKFGDLPEANDRLSAAGWLQKLRYWAIVGSLVGFVVTLLIPTSGTAAGITKNLLGSALFGVFLQLLMFPVKSLPRMAKFAIVTIGTGIVGTVLFQ